LVQRLDDHPALAAKEAPMRLLAPEEQARLNAITNPKRRRDWLLGRWTAKQLLRALAEQSGKAAPLPAITIASDENGAPYTRFGVGTGAGWSLSLSHSRGVAFCAAMPGAGCRLGADIEWIEPRADGFAGDYLTPAELALVARAGSARDSLITAMWSAKEAALKALRLGLRVDTRAVSCLIAPERDAAPGWQPFGLAWDERQFEQEQLPLPAGGWQRLWHGFVLTLVAQPPRGWTGKGQKQ
jgi:4'-phosphopantetheinyl transferase